jgi:hypothetical protein
MIYKCIDISNVEQTPFFIAIIDLLFIVTFFAWSHQVCLAFFFFRLDDGRRDQGRRRRHSPRLFFTATLHSCGTVKSVLKISSYIKCRLAFVSVAGQRTSMFVPLCSYQPKTAADSRNMKASHNNAQHSE